MKTAKNATVMTSTTAKAMATITQNQNAVIRGHSTANCAGCGALSGRFGLQTPARAPCDGDRHDPVALDDLEYLCQPVFLAPRWEIDPNHRHRGVAVGAARGAHRLGGMPAALGTCAPAAGDGIESHPLRSARRRGIPTSLHIPTTLVARGTLQLCRSGAEGTAPARRHLAVVIDCSGSEKRRQAVDRLSRSSGLLRILASRLNAHLPDR